jgi:hypothetical protein
MPCRASGPTGRVIIDLGPDGEKPFLVFEHRHVTCDGLDWPGPGFRWQPEFFPVGNASQTCSSFGENLSMPYPVHRHGGGFFFLKPDGPILDITSTPWGILIHTRS